jgi:Flp pilus assembly protein TadB
MTNPSYLGELTESTMGVVAIALAVVLMIAGGAWIKKIVQVQF